MTKPLAKVLVVDDNPDITEYVKEYCDRFVDDFATVVTNSPLQAIDLLRKHDDIHLMVTDIHMPEMNGIDLLNHVREEFPGLLFVVITAYGSDILRKEVEDMGVVKYIEKPFQLSNFVDIIRLSLQASAEGFEGFVDLFELPDIIQLIAISGKSSQLQIKKSGKEGWLYFENGTLIHAESKDLVGDEAFYEIFSWSGGQFIHSEHKIEVSQTIATDWQSLLLEAARVKDEALAPKHKKETANQTPSDVLSSEIVTENAKAPLSVQKVLTIDGIEEILNGSINYYADQFPQDVDSVSARELPTTTLLPYLRRHMEFFFDQKASAAVRMDLGEFDYEDSGVKDAIDNLKDRLIATWQFTAEDYRTLLLETVGFLAARSINPVVAISEFLIHLSGGEVAIVKQLLPQMIEKEIIPLPYTPLIAYLDEHDSHRIDEDTLSEFIRSLRMEWEVSIGPAKMHYALQRLLDLAAVGSESSPREFDRELIHLMHESRGMTALANYFKLKLPPSKFTLTMAEYKDIADNFTSV